MVVSDSAAASRIGTAIIAKGGNAVDAAVATAFALAVSWPDAGNIGGGGFMMIRPADGKEPICIDYREVAPLSMHAKSFNRTDTTFSHKAVGVPGTVRGLAFAHQKYGKLPWKELVTPAAKLAKDGVQVDRPLADSLNSVLSEDRVREQSRFAEFRRVFGHPQNREWRPGDQLKQPDLANTLKQIAQIGPDAFYLGEIAEKIVQEMRRGDGEISKDDLEAYQAKSRSIIRGNYRGYTILGAPPPSSGGTCIVEALNILECFDLAKHSRYHPTTVHLIAESMRRAFADRAMHLGDPDFVEIPKHLTEKSYARKLASEIKATRATPSHQIGPPISEPDESPDTTHFSIVDAEGMAVSNTYTLEATWGSRIVVRDAGFVLNNEMGDFNWFPGETNVYGRIGTKANQLNGGKRMLSSQCPVIVERDGELIMVTGSPGGRTIINTVLCILINLIDFEKSPVESVASPRMHHQWYPDRILLEKLNNPPHSEIADRLTEMGHNVADRPAQGSAHTVAIDPENQTRIGISDFRRSGRPSAFHSESVAKWEFDEPAGTPLAQTLDSGEGQLRWNDSISNAKSNGFDHLRFSATEKNEDSEKVEKTEKPLISPANPSTESRSKISVKLPPTKRTDRTNQWMLEIKIDSLHFAGDDFDEMIGFSLSRLSETTIAWDAMLCVGRRGNDEIQAWTQINGKTGESVSLSAASQLTQPILLRVEFNSGSKQLKIHTRNASTDSWKTTLSSPFNPKTAPNAVTIELDRLNLGPNEWIDIDRVEIMRSWKSAE